MKQIWYTFKLRRNGVGFDQVNLLLIDLKSMTHCRYPCLGKST